MSDHVIHDAVLPLRGEKVSMASLSFLDTSGDARIVIESGLDFIKLIARRAAEAGPLCFLLGAIGLWAVPALLLYRYRLEQLVDAVARMSLRGALWDLLSLFVALTYVVATGLLVACATACLARRLARGRKVLRLVMTPLICLSLVATMITAVPFFLGALCWCFPSLL
jgi:hypothetical protein